MKPVYRQQKKRERYHSKHPERRMKTIEIKQARKLKDRFLFFQGVFAFCVAVATALIAVAALPSAAFANVIYAQATDASVDNTLGDSYVTTGFPLGSFALGSSATFGFGSIAQVYGYAVQGGDGNADFAITVFISTSSNATTAFTQRLVQWSGDGQFSSTSTLPTQLHQLNWDAGATSTLPAATYYMYAYQNGGSTGSGISHIYSGASGNLFGYITDDGGGSAQLLVTQIASVTPAFGSTVATSSNNIEATGYIAPSQYVAGNTNIRVTINANGCSANGVAVLIVLENPCVAYGYVLPITGSGFFDVSTTTQGFSAIGGYQSEYELQVPSIYPTVQTDLVATSGVFTVATSTVLDQFIKQSQGILTALSSTTVEASNVCNPANYSDFNFSLCVASLFEPDPQTVSAFGGSMVSDVQSFAFSNFILEMYSGVQDTNATTSLPTWNVSLPNNTPAKGYSVNLTPWTLLFQSGNWLASTTDPNTGLTLQQIVSPGWTFFVYSTGAVVIFIEVLGVGGKVISGGL